MSLNPDLYRAVPPAKAIEYLKQKVSLPSQKWSDFLDAQHDAIFTVAGAKAHIVQDIKKALVAALEEGQTLSEFTERFRDVAKDWVGADNWRAKTIYQTNMRMAYAAGRYAHQLDPEVLKVQPYLQYVHSDSAVPRPLHEALDGEVFRADEIPFPVPNGFGCGCRYVSLSEKDLEEEELSVSSLKRGDVIETEEGEMILEPEKGFDYIPGQTKEEQRWAILEESIKDLPDYLKDQVFQEIDAKLKMVLFTGDG